MNSPKLWIDRMSTWQSPDEFADLVTECSDEFKHGEVLRKQGLGFWRDAWIALQYSRLANVELVRLVKEQYPDFETILHKVESRYEATEVLDPERRRDDEIKETQLRVSHGQSTVVEDPQEGWLTINRAKSGLEGASISKSEKNYSADTRLIIYLNWSDYFVQESGIVAIMADATVKAGKCFRSVDVLWREELFHVWDNGQKIS